VKSRVVVQERKGQGSSDRITLMPVDALSRGVRGGSAIIAGQFVKLAIQFSGVVVLSRLLEPADFGLVAMVTIFLAFGSLLRDFGMPTAALQAKELSDQQAANFFWASTMLGAGAAILLVAASPLLATVYGEPRLAVVAPVMATTLLLNGVQAQVQVQLARALRFTSLALTDVVAQAVALAVAIGGALAGWGYWAVVLQPIVAAILLLLLRALVTRWIPRLPRRGHGSRALYRTGGNIGVAQVLAFVANNVDTFVIGVALGTTQLGIYNRAFQFYAIPRIGMLDPLTQVVVPTLNQATTSGERSASSMLLRIQFALSAVLTLVFLIIATTADWLIPLLLGDQWHEAVLPLRLLAFGGFFAAFGTVSYWVFLIEGKSRHLLHLHLVTKPMMAALVLAGLPFGIVGVALGYAVAQALAWPINLVWLARVAGQDSWAFFRTGMRTVLAAGLGFLTAHGVLMLVDLHGNLSPVLLGATVALLIYVGALTAMPGGVRELSDALRVARALVRR